MKGKKRNREVIAGIVCENICNAWGGTMEEVSDHLLSFLTELGQVL
jgi:hypothetical protein